MIRIQKLILLTLAFGLAIGVGAPAQAQDKKPNILFIMGDGIGMWNIGAYHRGMMAGRTPNLDKLAKGAGIAPAHVITEDHDHVGFLSLGLRRSAHANRQPEG